MKEFIHYEESDFFSTKKDAKQERKRSIKRDRSKFKKTDRDKIKEKNISETGLQTAIISSIRGAEIFVDTGKESVCCTLRGLFKKENANKTSPIIVGDRIFFDEERVIQKIEPRHSILSRADHLSQKKEHCIAANVDLVLITVSVIDPPLRPSIIDRYLIAAKKGKMQPIILCNKIDLLDDAKYNERDHEKALLSECKAIYESIGVPFIELSTVTKEGIDTLRELMKNRTSVFSGQSGSGKSSLLNAIAGFDLRVGKTVAASRKGSHTTSHAELLRLPFGGYVIDTPGIKSFGLWDVKKEEVRELYSDIATIAKNCRFQNCCHRGEAGCAIPDALEKGILSPLRYESYLNLLLSIESEHYRR
jgi:ribosome biogenesis GTPase